MALFFLLGKEKYKKLIIISKTSKELIIIKIISWNRELSKKSNLFSSFGIIFCYLNKKQYNVFIKINSIKIWEYYFL